MLADIKEKIQYILTKFNQNQKKRTKNNSSFWSSQNSDKQNFNEDPTSIEMKLLEK